MTERSSVLDQCNICILLGYFGSKVSWLVLELESSSSSNDDSVVILRIMVCSAYL